jgi:hypothetical protein
MSTSVAFVVAKGKKELRRVVAQIDDTGKVASSGESVDDADITFTLTEADAQLVHDGQLELPVGFMRGQIKMAGDFGKLLQFLPLTAGPTPPVAVPSLL